MTVASPGSSLTQDMVYAPGVPGRVTEAPPKTIGPPQRVLSAVRVLEVNPKFERQELEAPPAVVAGAVTVKPAGKVTVRVDERTWARSKESENVALSPAWRRERATRLLLVAVVVPVEVEASKVRTRLLVSSDTKSCELDASKKIWLGPLKVFAAGFPPRLTEPDENSPGRGRSRRSRRR
jgi:hypothetical protein